jgi:hypothetical protein
MFRYDPDDPSSGIKDAPLLFPLEYNSLIVTSRGYLGIALTPEVGDRVAMLHGTEFMSLLRPCPGRDHHFRFVPQAELSITTGEYDDFWEEQDAGHIYLV